jgi:hypothetical protein
MLALGVSLLGAVFAGGMQIGTLTERMEAQIKQIETMTEKLDALTDDFNGTRLEMMRLFASHTEPAPASTGRTR